ncbi:hypothetical protein [Micromonospora sp. NPDC023644]|uniref:hypothetical protein n=1 Tax=Micromonospora sp. NPDC023644 TaxID=3154321 RepID=UPI0033D01CCF
MTRYDTGRRFEWKTRDDMTANGYDVLRAAGSKGGTKIDLVGFKPGQLLVVQCKEDGKLGPAEWNRVHEVAGWVGAIPLLAANGPRGRGVTYTRLLGPKIPRARTQPCEPFHLDEIAAAARWTDEELDDCAFCVVSPRRPAGCPIHDEPAPVVVPHQTGHTDHLDPETLAAHHGVERPRRTIRLRQHVRDALADDSQP